MRAEEVFRLGLAQSPVNPWCANHHGYLLATEGRFDEAIEQLDLALELYLLNPIALSRRPLDLVRRCKTVSEPFLLILSPTGGW